MSDPSQTPPSDPNGASAPQGGATPTGAAVITAPPALGPPGGKNSPKKLITRERMRQVLELRRAGATLDQIARQLGYAGPSSVHKVLSSAMKSMLKEPAEELRKLEYERLERLTLAVWPQAQKGHLGAIQSVLRLMERRAKLLGLDAPARIALQGGAEGAPALRVQSELDVGGMSTDDLRKLDELLAKAAAGAPKNGTNGSTSHEVPV